MSRVAGAGATGTQDARGAARGARGTREKRGLVEEKRGAAGKKIPPGNKKGGGEIKKGTRVARLGFRYPFQESLKIGLLERRASCEALPVNDRLNYLPSFVNMRMAAYPIMTINTQMNHFMLSPPFFLEFWKEICVSSQNALD